MINLLNYETFFLLYADGELSPAEQEVVLKFVEQHSLLEEEFNRIKTLKFSPDKDVVMVDKSMLRIKIPAGIEANYSFVPDLSIVYPNKAELYRKENILPVYWLRMVAVAAAISFTMGIVWLVMGDKENDASIALETLVEQGSSSTGATALSSPNAASLSTEHTMGASTANSPHQSVGERAASPIATALAVSSEKPVGTEDPKEQMTTSLQQTTTLAAPQVVAPDLSAASLSQQVSVPQKGNFSEAVLLAGAERMATSAAPMASEPNASLLINAALKEEKKSGFRSILRTINRRLLNDQELPEDQKFIQVANFYIPVNK